MDTLGDELEACLSLFKDGGGCVNLQYEGSVEEIEGLFEPDWVVAHHENLSMMTVELPTTGCFSLLTPTSSCGNLTSMIFTLGGERMNHGRIDPHLRELFSKIGPSSVQSSHGVAASLSDDSAREILRELPAVGPVTYLSSLEVIVADVEKDGFEYLVDTPDVHAISDAEHLHELPEPLDIEKKMNRTSRDVMRGDSEMFDGYEGKGITVAVPIQEYTENTNALVVVLSEQISCVSGSTYDGDKDGHGTHVAGSIGGERFGSATEASIVDLRVFGYNFGRTTGASTATLLQALDLVHSKRG